MRQLTISQSITNRESESVTRYLAEISKLEMISAEEEVRLAAAIKNGDAEALEKLTKANLRFVVSVAKQYQFKGLSLPDLINEGNLGLIKAAQRFDETKGFKFISYAVWWIRQGIMQALSEQSRLVRLPGNQVGLSKRLQHAYNHLEQEHERAPSDAELAEAMHLSEAEIAAASTYEYYHVSLDAPFLGQNEGCLGDMLEDMNGEQTDAKVAYTQSLQLELNRSLQQLDKRQKDVISSYFGIGVPAASSLDEIASRLNLTKERVRQIKDKALHQLRLSKKSGLLKEFLR